MTYYDDREIKPKNTYTVEDWKYILENLSTLDLDSLHSGFLKFSTDFIDADK